MSSNPDARTKAVWLLLSAALAGCFYRFRPVVMDSAIPDLRVDPSARIRLKVAVVVPDPHGHRVLLAHRNAAGDSGARDVTGEFREEAGLPIGRELAKLCAGAFRQVFTDAEIMRQPPAQGAYELVVSVRVKNLALQRNFGSLLPATDRADHIVLTWQLAAQDKEGLDLLVREETLTGAQFKSVAGLTPKSRDEYIRALGANLSPLLSDLARVWAMRLFESKAVREYAEGEAPL